MFHTLASTISLHHQTTKRARRQDEATRQIRLSKKRNSEKSTVVSQVPKRPLLIEQKFKNEFKCPF